MIVVSATYNKNWQYLVTSKQKDYMYFIKNNFNSPLLGPVTHTHVCC